jgi:hypothetical protein
MFGVINMKEYYEFSSETEYEEYNQLMFLINQQ